MLSGKQRRFLRGLGHHLDPVVHVGKDGLSEGLFTALEAAIVQHELIKIRLTETVEDDRHEVASRIAEVAGGDVVQVLGRTILLYRPREKDPTIVLPPGPSASLPGNDTKT